MDVARPRTFARDEYVSVVLILLLIAEVPVEYIGVEPLQQNVLAL